MTDFKHYFKTKLVLLKNKILTLIPVTLTDFWSHRVLFNFPHDAVLGHRLPVDCQRRALDICDMQVSWSSSGTY